MNLLANRAERSSCRILHPKNIKRKDGEAGLLFGSQL
jgi:hypothetical protein